jgi:hypothetical protein
MELLLVLVLLIGIGPLALLLGVDSRDDDARGWWPAAPRGRRPGLRERAARRLEATTANCAEERLETLAGMESLP